MALPLWEEEGGRDVVGNLRAQLLAGYLIEAEVLPRVDAAEAGLVGRVREARECALDSRQDFRGDSKALVVAEKTLRARQRRPR